MTKQDNDCESSSKSGKQYANVVAVVINFCALDSRYFSLHQCIQAFCLISVFHGKKTQKLPLYFVAFGF